MRRAPALVVALLAALAVSVQASAQSGESGAAASSWYLGAVGFGNSTQTGDDVCPYICGKLGGWSAGGAAMVGRIVGRTSWIDVGVEGEAAVDAGVSTPVSVRTSSYMQGGGRTFTADRRTALASLLLRAGTRRRGREPRVEAVGGVVLELARELSRDIVDAVPQGWGQPVLQVSQPDESNVAASVGFCVGADLVVALGRRTDVVLGARFYRFRRGDYDGTQQFPIPGATAIRVQAGVRWNW